MKLLLCSDCGDLVIPNPHPRAPRPCACGRHAVWWENPERGIVRVWDHDRVPLEGPLPESYSWGAWIIGLHNTWLRSEISGRAGMDAVLEDTPESYLFKQQNSIAIKVRPGQSGDSAYAELPAA